MWQSKKKGEEGKFRDRFKGTEFLVFAIMFCNRRVCEGGGGGDCREKGRGWEARWEGMWKCWSTRSPW